MPVLPIFYSHVRIAVFFSFDSFSKIFRLLLNLAGHARSLSYTYKEKKTRDQHLVLPVDREACLHYQSLILIVRIAVFFSFDSFSKIFRLFV